MSTRRELQVVISGVDKVSGPVAAAMSRIAATLDRVKAAVRPFGAAFDLTFGKALAGGRSVVSMLTSVRTMLLGVGAAVVANRFVGWVTDSVRELDEFGERARQLGVAVEWLSAAEYGAKLANEEIGSLGDALRKGMENLQEGLGERTGAVALLDRLGIKADDAEGKLRPLNQLVAELQKNLAGATQGERLDAFRDVFGRNGQVLERLTAGGAMERYASELERLGGTITSSQVEAASRLDDAMDRTSAAWRGIKHQFVEAVAEPVEVALNALSSALARVPDAVRGAGSLLTQWLQGYGTGSGIQAGDKLLDLLKAGGELMYDYIRGGFEVGWAVVTNGAASLLAWLSPKVSDMLQMAASKVLPSWMVSAPASGAYYGKMQELEEARGRMRMAIDPGEGGGDARRAEYTERDISYDANTGQFVRRRVTLTGQDAMAYAMRELDPLITRLEREVAELEPAVRRSEAERTAVVQASLGAGARDIVAVAESVRARIDASAQRWDTALSAVAQVGREARSPVRGRPLVGSYEGDGFAWGGGVVAPRPAMPDGSAYGPGREVFEAQNRVAEMMREVRDRLLRATGQDSAADREKMLRDQALQVVQLEELGLAGTEYAAAMEKVHAVELARFDTAAKLAPLMQQVEEAQKRYTEAVEQYQQQAELGEMNKGLLSANTVNAAQRLAAELALIRQRVREVVEAAPGMGTEFAAELNKVGSAADEAARKVRRLIGDENQSFFEGFSRGWTRWGDTIRTVGQTGEDVAQRLGDGFGQYGDAIVGAISGTERWGDVFRNVTAGILKDIASVLARMAVLRLVSGIGSAFSGGAGDWGASAGSSSGASFGGLGGRGFIFGGGKSNSGGGGGFVFAPVVQVNAPMAKNDADKLGRDMVQTFFSELEKSSAARNQMKAVLR